MMTSGNPDRRVAFQVRLPVSLVLALDAKADQMGESTAALLERMVRAGLSRATSDKERAGVRNEGTGRRLNP